MLWSAHSSTYTTSRFSTPLLTLLAFVFALDHGSQRMGWGRPLLLLGCTFGVSLLFESVGVATGLVYEKYNYTNRLGYKFLDLVPLLIRVAWFMMAYPAYVIAERIVPARWGVWCWRVGVAAVGGVIITAWDLAMDPMMVASEHWVCLWGGGGVFQGAAAELLGLVADDFRDVCSFSGVGAGQPRG